MRPEMNQHFGSDFDDFLAEEGLLVEVEAVAVKRVLAYQVEQEMKQRNLSKTEMARRMGTSRAALNRLLDPKNTSITLQTLSKVAQTLGKRLQIFLTEERVIP
jgi:DNA-binding Xre family transcriptional regulator